MKQCNKLKSELKQAGASDLEVNEFIRLAGSLTQLKNPKSIPELPAVKFQQRTKWKGFLSLGVASITGIALGMALVILSQTTLPGSLLYPIQKLSDRAAVSVDPDYRGIVMMKSAQQVEQLVADHANSNLVLATLGDYMTEASVYESSSANYAAFEYCKSSLQQAAAVAPSPERQAIEHTLSSLEDV